MEISHEINADGIIYTPIVPKRTAKIYPGAPTIPNKSYVRRIKVN